MVKNEFRLLEENGVDVEIYTVSNESINQMNFIQKSSVVLETPWSFSKYKFFKKLLKEKNPDIVHIHNFFPLISPSVYFACKQLGIPVVQTLHNYRLLCPSAMFLREGKVCEECVSNSLLKSISSGCYRGSKLQTIPVATMIKLNKIFNTWNSKVAKYITLTNFAKEKFIEGGIDPDRISVKPNFTFGKDFVELEREKYFLYVGRISTEKGLEILLRSWDQLNTKGTKLLIIGDGPQKDSLELQYKHKENVVFLGKLNHDEVIKYMQKALYLVMPSIWYEGFPMTVIESYSVGTPVIASNIGSLSEIIIDNKTGYKFIPNDSDNLAEILKFCIDYGNHKKLINGAYNEFNEKYVEKVNFVQLKNIYLEAISINKND